ncbi:MlaC/ttg2D family ABC transporter substrate-binding protein [Methylobacterium sp. sgz302541]|uniref:MlaC/ttg2D family ABC transporter substrate-binding protein n=1 Tax=unclassified Methylobacterium TaxID=2615210 RepID=UPI003D34B479
MFAAPLALALAGAAIAYAPAARADDAAVSRVRALFARFDSVMTAPGDVRSRSASVDQPLKDAFDFAAMTRLAVGPRWKALEPAQQDALTAAFARHFAVLYTSRLGESGGGRVEIAPESEARGENRIVHSKIVRVGGDGTQVDFVVNPEGRVQDVLLNGSVSEVASQHALYAKPLKAGGVDGLLKFLRERTDRMLSAPPTP